MTDRIEQELRRAAAGLEPPHLDARAFADHAAELGLAEVAYALVDSPVGDLLVANTKRGLVRIAYLDNEPPGDVLQQIAARLSPRVLEAPGRVDEIRRQLDSYFEGRLTRFELPIDWSLVGPFGRRVLHRTARIPYGDVSTYGQVARDIGTPRAARATGNALGANPMPIVVPCHRVLRSGGALGGYGGGVERKKQLLALEQGQLRL